MGILLGVLPEGQHPVRSDARTGEPVVQFTYPGGQVELLPVWAGEGFPRDAERAMQEWGPVPIGLGHAPVPVLVAHRFSSGTRRLLDTLGWSWADETGRARISAGHGLFIDRDRAPTAAEREHLTPALRWAPSAGAVAEHLLVRRALLRASERSDSFLAWPIPRPAEVAEDIDWSPPQVSKVLQSFDSEGWTEKGGAERGPNATRTLVDPNGLLSAWAGWHRTRRLPSISAHATWRDPQQFVRERLLPAFPAMTVAFSSWVALDVVAPLMTDVPTVNLYVADEVFDQYLPNVMSEVGLRRVETGARVTLHRAEAHVLRQGRRVHELPVVSDIRLFGDLLRHGVRGEDAADHLRETTIGF